MTYSNETTKNANRYIMLVQKYETAKAQEQFGLADAYALRASQTGVWLINHGVQERTLSALRSQALATMAA